MNTWHSVTKSNRCPVCGKPDWCTTNGEVVFCMRVANDKPKTFADGSIGYRYQADGSMKTAVLHRRQEPKPVINVRHLMVQWWQYTEPVHIQVLSKSLGVAASALIALQVAWCREKNAAAFPMQDGYGNFTGIRLRANNGVKWAVTGSHQGLFVPQEPPQKVALVCEGPTSCAAGVALGYFCIGLPSAGAGVAHLIPLLKRLGVQRVAVIADNKVKEDGEDDRGLSSASMVAGQLPVPTCVVTLPAKDLRDFVLNKGTALLLESILDQQVWRRSV